MWSCTCCTASAPGRLAGLLLGLLLGVRGLCAPELGFKTTGTRVLLLPSGPGSGWEPLALVCCCCEPARALAAPGFPPPGSHCLQTPCPCPAFHWLGQRSPSPLHHVSRPCPRLALTPQRRLLQRTAASPSLLL